VHPAAASKATIVPATLSSGKNFATELVSL
jgi:hypothetical protein